MRYAIIPPLDICFSTIKSPEGCKPTGQASLTLDVSGCFIGQIQRHFYFNKPRPLCQPLFSSDNRLSRLLPNFFHREVNYVY